MSRGKAPNIISELFGSKEREMQVSCPGCNVGLQVDDDSYDEKVLLQCPECLYVFMAKADDAPSAGSQTMGDATLLTSDFSKSSKEGHFKWKTPGASITVIEGDDQGVHRKIKDKLLIGRKGADLVVEDKAVSRKHCEIKQKGADWWLIDLDSTNGTVLNGKNVDEVLLSHLDEIKLGNTRILFSKSGADVERSFDDRGGDDPDLDRTKIDTVDQETEHSMPEGREFYLEYMSGPNKARSLKLDKGRVILGRGEEADINVDDTGVSRKQAMIEIISRDQIYISDLASQNGTWLNGIRIRTTKFFHGDLLRMGNTIIKFVIQDIP
jgi:pSer/pThr/pTyr-binding forkhead associated (FHA) protein